MHETSSLYFAKVWPHGTFPHNLHQYLFRIGTGLHIFIGLLPNRKSTLHPSYSCSVWVNHPYQLCHITRSGESTKHRVEWIGTGMVVCEHANRKHKICSLPVLEQCNPQSEEGVWVSTHRCCLVTWGCHMWEDGRSDGSKWWETAGSLWRVNIVPNTAQPLSRKGADPITWIGFVFAVIQWPCMV